MMIISDRIGYNSTIEYTPTRSTQFLNSEYFSIITCLISGKPWILFCFHWERRRKKKKMLGIFLNCFFHFGRRFHEIELKYERRLAVCFHPNSFSLYYFPIPTHPENRTTTALSVWYAKETLSGFHFLSLLWTLFSLFHWTWPKCYFSGLVECWWKVSDKESCYFLDWTDDDGCDGKSKPETGAWRFRWSQVWNLIKVPIRKWHH